MASNFKVFHESEKIEWTWAIAILSTLVIFGGIFLVPGIDKAPRNIIPFLYTGLIALLVKHYQAKSLNAHAEAEGAEFSWWRLLVVSLAGAVVTLLAVAAVLVIVESGESKATNTYGSLHHEISFDPNNISSARVDSIGEAFMQLGFFDQANKKYLYVKQSGDELEISISCPAGIANNPEGVQGLVMLLRDTKKLMPNQKIKFNLVEGRIDNVVKRLE